MCILGRSEAALSRIHRGKIVILPTGPNCQMYKNRFSWLFQSCVKTILGHNVQFHKKSGQGKVFCDY